ncbi:MAG TPA: DUF4432 family protein [Trebonia sp.]|nr:DUF4432 family protein [Trebonia sp.]
MAALPSRPARNWGARVHEVTMACVRAVVLENELLRVTVLAGLGSDVIEFCYKPRDLDATWLSPGGLRDPRQAAGAAADDVSAFLDRYRGGWQEVLPNGGAPSRHRGAALAQHGEVSGLPWDAEVTADDAAAVEVTFSVRTKRMPLRVSKTMRLAAGAAQLTISESVTNEAAVPVAAMWGQHLAYGPPLLVPGCRIKVPNGLAVTPHPDPINPPRRLVAAGGPWEWPVVPAADGGEADLSVVPPWGAPSDIVYLSGFTEGWYELLDPAGTVGVRVEWDAAVLPYLWLWTELGASRDYPWWGQGRVLGLEPFSSYPTSGLAEAVANGTALDLPPGGRRELRWRIGIVDTEVRTTCG